MKRTFKQKKAFTLIELLIVIAIIGILFIVLVSKVDFATDKAKATGVQTDFRSFQAAFELVSKEHAGFNTFGWDTGDANGNRVRDSVDVGDTDEDGVYDAGETWTGRKKYIETWTGVYTLINPSDANDYSAIFDLETAINHNLDPKLHIMIENDGTISMANGHQDPWNTQYHGRYLTNASADAAAKWNTGASMTGSAGDNMDRGAMLMFSNGANQKFGTKVKVEGGVVTATVSQINADTPDNNTLGADDYVLAVVYTYTNGYGETGVSTTGFSNNQNFLTGNGGGASIDGPAGPGTPVTPTAAKLAKPVISVSGTVVTLTSSDANADHTSLYVDGVCRVENFSGTCDLQTLGLSAGAHTITAKSFPATGDAEHSASDYSSNVNYSTGYTVSFQYVSWAASDPNNNEATDCVLRITFGDGHTNDVTVNDSLPESTTYQHVVGLQMLAQSNSSYLYYTMGGVANYLYHAGSGNPSEYLALTSDITLNNAVYEQACISADSLVTMADGSLKRLGDIRTGDYVLSYDWDTMQLIPRKVIYSSCEEENWDSGAWDVVRYFRNVFSDGTVIDQAFAHRFYNAEDQAFTYLEQWDIGDHTYSNTGDTPYLVSREVVYETIRYARITLEGGTNYFANGLLTGDRHCPQGIVFE